MQFFLVIHIFTNNSCCFSKITSSFFIYVNLQMYHDATQIIGTGFELTKASVRVYHSAGRYRLHDSNGLLLRD